MLARLPTKAVFQYNVIPVSFDGATLLVASNNPINPGLIDALRLASGSRVQFALSPAADIANTALPYLLGSRNDFIGLFGDPSPSVTLILAACCLVYVIAGFFIQRRLYRQAGLSGAAYLALAASTFILLGIVWAL